MSKLKDSYRKYRQYIGTDVLMYGVFILVLAIMVIFFG
jgi:predicted nucleic acid-binding Zn ribbon protein